jgi:hypothetical protein
VEATLASRTISCLHRQSRGRWIGASSRRDGGGSPRGPPSHHSPSRNSLFAHSAPQRRGRSRTPQNDEGPAFRRAPLFVYF